MNKRAVSHPEFAQVVNQLQGHAAWRSRAGSGTGSIFTLQFGLALATDEKWGEFSLMVSCAWRIAEAGSILCTWHEDADGALAPALKALEGMVVTEASLSELGDLTIHLATGRTLQVWNDAPYADSESWFLGHQGKGYYEVGVRNKFTYEAEG